MNIAVVSKSFSCQHTAGLSPPLLMQQRTYSVLFLSPNHNSKVPTVNQQSLLHPHLASHNRHKSKRNNYIVMQASSLRRALLPRNVVILSLSAYLEVLLIAAETCCSHHNIALTLGPPFSLTLLLYFLHIHTVGSKYGYKGLVGTVSCRMGECW